MEKKDRDLRLSLVNKTKHDILLGVIAKGSCVIRSENVAVMFRVKEKRTPKVTLCVI